jgi:hypothetical protein
MAGARKSASTALIAPRSASRSDRAKQFTAELAFGQTVTVVPMGRDRYGRTVADVFLPDNRLLNHELVKAGFAWWYRRYALENIIQEQFSETRGRPSVGYGLITSQCRRGSGMQLVRGNRQDGRSTHEPPIHSQKHECPDDGHDKADGIVGPIEADLSSGIPSYDGTN